MLKGVVATVLLGMTASAAWAADPTGVWTRPSGASRIEIKTCGNGLCGDLVWLKTPANDTKNPDPAKRSQSLIGRRIVHDLRPTKTAGEWKGEVYNAEDGRTYTGYATLIGANQLKLQGCVLGGLICKGETWTRVD